METKETRLNNLKQYEAKNIDKILGGIVAIGISNEDNSDSE